jgi:putative membrane protein
MKAGCRRESAARARASAGRRWGWDPSANPKKLTAATTIALSGVATRATQAHELHFDSHAWSQWTFEPITIALLTITAVVYACGLLNLWRRAGVDRGIRVWQASAFAAGVVTMIAALVSPIAWISESLLSVHMTQHEILMLLSAPLLVFGQPLLAALWMLPSRARERVAPRLNHPAIRRPWRAVTAPLTVFALHGAALWIWHTPALYEAAIASPPVHALEHFCFVVTAALFWWGMIHGRYGRVSYGVGVVYVFLTAVHSSVLGALMTVAPSTWYGWYARAAGTWHVDALQDQQIAGLLMWVPSGLVFIVFGLALFAAWLGESERRAALGTVHAAATTGREAPDVA